MTLPAGFFPSCFQFIQSYSSYNPILWLQLQFQSIAPMEVEEICQFLLPEHQITGTHKV